MEFRGSRSQGHLKTAQMNSVRNFDPALFSTFNSEFLQLLQRCYRIRYIDAVPVGFNLAVASRECLAELDLTACSFQRRFKLNQAGEPQTLIYDALIESKDPRLVAENHLLAGQDKAKFIATQPQLVYEVRRFPKRGLMEVLYLAKAKASDGRFLRAALSPQDDSEMDFTLAFETVETNKA